MDGHEADPSDCDLVLAMENWSCRKICLCSSSSTVSCWDAAVWVCDHLGETSLADPWSITQWLPWWICWRLEILSLCTADWWTVFTMMVAKSYGLHVVPVELWTLPGMEHWRQ